MSSDFAWLTEHSLEIYEKYAGKWIAVRDGKVVGVGSTASEAAEQAKAARSDAPFILELVDPEPERV
jgi:ABC-type phosphate/phosphonate transport system ATPase subunit